MSYIHSGLKITFKNEITRRELRPDAPGRHPGVPGTAGAGGPEAGRHGDAVHVARSNGEKMEAALQWTEATDETIRS